MSSSTSRTAKQILTSPHGRPSLEDLHLVRLTYHQTSLPSQKSTKTGRFLTVAGGTALWLGSVPAVTLLSLTGLLLKAYQNKATCPPALAKSYVSLCSNMLNLREAEDKFLQQAVQKKNKFQLCCLPLDEAASLLKTHPDLDQKRAEIARLQIFARLGMMKYNGKLPRALEADFTLGTTHLLLKKEDFTAKEIQRILNLHKSVEQKCANLDQKSGFFALTTRTQTCTAFTAISRKQPIPAAVKEYFKQGSQIQTRRQKAEKYIDAGMARLELHLSDSLRGPAASAQKKPYSFN